jgi:hypothetical protein
MGVCFALLLQVCVTCFLLRGFHGYVMQKREITMPVPVVTSSEANPALHKKVAPRPEMVIFWVLIRKTTLSCCREEPL